MIKDKGDKSDKRWTGGYQSKEFKEVDSICEDREVGKCLVC